MNRAWISITLVALLAIILIVAIQSNNKNASPPRSVGPIHTAGQTMLPTKTITVGQETLTVEVATTDEEKQSGLSGRAGLAEDTGMLFVFEPAVAEGFWMKDMLFSLDIIWADASGTIITIDPDLSPATYPNVFRPSAPAKYVLEVPAGYVKAHSIAVGDKISI